MGRRAWTALALCPGLLVSAVLLAGPAAATDAPSPTGSTAPTETPSAEVTPEPSPTATSTPTPTPRATSTPAPTRPAAPEPGATDAPDRATPEPRIAEQPPRPELTPPPPPVLVPYDPDAPLSGVALGPPPLEPVTFTDVASRLGDTRYSPFAAAIAWMGEQGIAAGTEGDPGEREYGPAAPVTRAAFAAFLYRLAGSPADEVPSGTPFLDATAASTPLWAPISWAGARGIATGTEDDAGRTFAPDAPLTRGALALMLHRFAGLPEAPDASPYVDLDPDSDLGRAAAWLAHAVTPLGWEGEEGLEFRADQELTRDVVAGVLHRAWEADVTLTEAERPLRLVTPRVVTVMEASTLHIREAASLDAAIVGAAAEGDELTTTGAVTDDGWVQIVHADGAAWVWGEHLFVDETDAVAVVADGDAPLSATYENGRIPATALCPLAWAPGHRLACGAAADLAALDVALHERFGTHVPLTDSYRTLAGQVTARATKGAMAAVPGTSQHGWGEAIDLDVGALPEGAYAWLVKAAPAYGWGLPTWASPGGAKPEPWHFEHRR